MGFESHLSAIGVTLNARNHNTQVLVGQVVLELLSPLKQARTLIPQHIEYAGIFKLVRMLQTVQIKMEQWDPPAVMHRHQGERGARYGALVTQAARYALGEVGLSHAETACKHQHVAVLQA